MNATATPTKPTHKSIDVCNRLLRGEIAAVETYGQAIEKFDGEPQTDVLQRIKAEHESSADILRYRIETFGGTPDESSGGWGVFAQAVQGAANLLGAGSAIASLKQGEEWGQSEYLNVLGDPALDPSIDSLVSDQLLPHIVEHIRTLDSLGELV